MIYSFFLNLEIQILYTLLMEIATVYGLPLIGVA